VHVHCYIHKLNINILLTNLLYGVMISAWSAYIKFEMRQGEIIRARGIYER
jgi:hypothetical protein